MSWFINMVKKALKILKLLPKLKDTRILFVVILVLLAMVFFQRESIHSLKEDLARKPKVEYKDKVIVKKGPVRIKERIEYKDRVVFRDTIEEATETRTESDFAQEPAICQKPGLELGLGSGARKEPIGHLGYSFGQFKLLGSVILRPSGDLDTYGAVVYRF